MKLTPIQENMTEVEMGTGKVLFSYKTPVAYINGLGQHFKTEKKWSATTTRHINKWLNGYKAEEKSQEFFDTLSNEVK